MNRGLILVWGLVFLLVPILKPNHLNRFFGLSITPTLNLLINLISLVFGVLLITSIKIRKKALNVTLSIVLLSDSLSTLFGLTVWAQPEYGIIVVLMDLIVVTTILLKREK